MIRINENTKLNYKNDKNISFQELPLIFTPVTERSHQAIGLHAQNGVCFGEGADLIVDNDEVRGESYTFFPYTVISISVINAELSV